MAGIVHGLQALPCICCLAFGHIASRDERHARRSAGTSAGEDVIGRAIVHDEYVPVKSHPQSTDADARRQDGVGHRQRDKAQITFATETIPAQIGLHSCCQKNPIWCSTGQLWKCRTESKSAMEEDR